MVIRDEPVLDTVRHEPQKALAEFGHPRKFRMMRTILQRWTAHGQNVLAVIY
jgi:hypothetical protein